MTTTKTFHEFWDQRSESLACQQRSRFRETNFSRIRGSVFWYLKFKPHALFLIENQNPGRTENRFYFLLAKLVSLEKGLINMHQFFFWKMVETIIPVIFCYLVVKTLHLILIFKKILLRSFLLWREEAIDIIK